jgi:DNA-binding NarL/FixJ family response regulator
MTSVKIPKEISDLHNNMKKNFNSYNRKESGAPALTALIPCHQKSYCCRGFFLNDPAVSYSKVPHVLMLLEKVSQHRQINLKSFKERFELTKRQMEILKLLGKGYSNKKIADELYIAEDTVKGHLKHIMKRLGVNTRTEILSMLFQPLILNGLEFQSTQNTRKMSSDHSGSSAEGIPSQK